MIRNGLPRARIYPRHVCPRRVQDCRGFSRFPALNWPQQWHKKPTLQPTSRLASQKACFHDSVEPNLDFEPETVYALSTAPGRAGIAIVRISGPSCVEVVTYVKNEHERMPNSYFRCTKPSAPPSHPQDLDMRPSERCTTPPPPPPHPTFSTLTRWFSTSLHRTP